MWQLVRDRLESTSQTSVDTVVAQILSDPTIPDTATVQRMLIAGVQTEHGHDAWEGLLAAPRAAEQLALTLRAMALVEQSSLGALAPQRLRDQADTAAIAETLARTRRPMHSTSERNTATPAPAQQEDPVFEQALYRGTLTPQERRARADTARPDTRVPAPPSWSGQSSTILFVDIAGFSRPDRTDRDRQAVRRAMYDALHNAFRRSSLPVETCHLEDRGDGALIIVPPSVAPETVIRSMPARVAEALHRHNSRAAPNVRFQLRVAVHAGSAYLSSDGTVSSQAINHTARLCDSQEFKQILADSQADVGVIFSDHVLHSFLAQDADAGTAGGYQRVTSWAKTTMITGWVRLLPENERRPSPPRQPPAPADGGLDEQDIRVLSLIAEGITADQAARRLDSSPRALRRQLRGICDRLQVNTPIQAVVWAARRQLLVSAAPDPPLQSSSPGTDCAKTMERLHSYLDNELDAAAMAQVRAHLEDCGPCLREYGMEEAVRKPLNRLSGHDRAPDALRARIQAGLTNQDRDADHVRIGGGWEPDRT